MASRNKTWRIEVGARLVWSGARRVDAMSQFNDAVYASQVTSGRVVYLTHRGRVVRWWNPETGTTMDAQNRPA